MMGTISYESDVIDEITCANFSQLVYNKSQRDNNNNNSIMVEDNNNDIKMVTAHITVHSASLHVNNHRSATIRYGIVILVLNSRHISPSCLLEIFKQAAPTLPTPLSTTSNTLQLLAILEFAFASSLPLTSV